MTCSKQRMPNSREGWQLCVIRPGQMKRKIEGLESQIALEAKAFTHLATLGTDFCSGCFCETSENNALRK